MLEKPKHGWSTISLPGWSDRCSYIDDVPFDLLEAFIRLFETHRLQAVELDAEGWEYIIVLGSYETYVIEEDGDMTEESGKDDHPSAHRVERNAKDLATELIADIRRDIDSWTDWQSYAEHSEEELQERKQKLLQLCDKLGKHISEGK